MDGFPLNLHRGRLPSIRIRLTVWMVIIALVIQLTLGLVVFLYQASSLDGLFDDRLRERSAPAAAFIENSTIRLILPDLKGLADSRASIPTNEPVAVAVFDSLGVKIGETGQTPVPSSVLPVSLSRVPADGVVVTHEVVGESGVTPWRFVTRPVKDKDNTTAYLVFGRPDSSYHSMLALIRRVLFLSLPVGVIGAGVAGWLISGLALAPVRRLRSVADALAPETIEKPLSVDVGAAELEDVQAVIEDVRERLRVAFSVRDRFIANVSHELKTPIAIILTEAQTLDQRTLSPDARLFVRSVIDEMRRLGRTIETFLTLTKVRAGKSFMEHSPCEVADFVMDAVLGCSRMARHHQVTINPLLADSDHPLFVTGDCELLRVLVDNLLRNAIRFSPENAQVIVHVSESDSECVIAVRDFGPGIPEGVIDSIFEPMTQAPSEARKGRGIGLGLSIAQTVAQLHSGVITAHNMAGAGCEFTVRLPRDPVTSGTRSAGTSQQQQQQQAGGG